jgi:hypothetical protein
MLFNSDTLAHVASADAISLRGVRWLMVSQARRIAWRGSDAS